MNERDFWIIMATLALMSVSNFLHRKMLACHDEQITKLREAVDFLMDRPPVSREAET